MSTPDRRHFFFTVSIDQLLLDPNNFRFVDQDGYKPVGQEQIALEDVQRRTRTFLQGERQAEIRDLLDSFQVSGWQPVDNVQVRPYPGRDIQGRERFVVVEGNRRVAALKFLKSEHEQKGADLGALSPGFFEEMPAVLYEGSGATDLHYMVLMGLKHISGNKKWPAINQARFIKRLVVEMEENPADVAKRVGIGMRELNLSLNTLALCELYQESEYGTQFRSPQYNLFREVLNKPQIRDWLGWIYRDPFANKVTTNLGRLFSWLSEEESGPRIADPEEQEEEETVKLKPVITAGYQIRELEKFITDESALRVLDRTRNLMDASLSSQRLVEGKVANAAEVLSSQINVLFGVMEHITPTVRKHIEGAAARLGALLSVAEGNRSTPIPAGQIPAFNDLPEHHFASIEVGCYRAHRDLSIRELRRVNVFGGFNNAGKTSLLEAIYLLTQQSRFDATAELLSWRAHERSLPGPWVWSEVLREASVSGRFDRRSQNLATLNLSAQRDAPADLDQAGYLGSVRLDASYAGEVQQTLTHIFADRRHQTTGRSHRVLCPALFSSPFMMHDTDVLNRLWDDTLRSKAKEKIQEFLREAVPWEGLEQIDRGGEFPRFVVSDGAFDRAVDISTFGAGVQRMFTIGLLFASARNGVVLIDELDNAIHASLLGPFARFLVEMAHEFHTQVFFTTHSRECIKAFVEPSLAEEVSYYVLQREDARTRCERLPGEELASLFEVMDIEPRRLQ